MSEKYVYHVFSDFTQCDIRCRDREISEEASGFFSGVFFRAASVNAVMMCSQRGPLYRFFFDDTAVAVTDTETTSRPGAGSFADLREGCRRGGDFRDFT